MTPISGGKSWVYPRVGGGTLAFPFGEGFQRGLSPRGRGNRLSLPTYLALYRSIPAWAGEPRWRSRRRPRMRVYPRVGGGTRGLASFSSSFSGLSPRGRGNPSFFCYEDMLHGSIPAWAGEPAQMEDTEHPAEVYPRVGGGTSPFPSSGPPTRGLSPRGRGNPSPAYKPTKILRSIPAWAGEPAGPAVEDLKRKVYPRVGGGTLQRLQRVAQDEGLSPRGRGNHPRGKGLVSRVRSIPAWAGEPSPRCPAATGKPVYPRVGGGTLQTSAPNLTLRGLSPRGRGNPGRLAALGPVRRSIPAWAGEPLSLVRLWAEIPVYPRVGGGTVFTFAANAVVTGLSPRGRGNPADLGAQPDPARSIPAWAGEPGQ